MKQPRWAWGLSVLLHPLWMPFALMWLLLKAYAPLFFLWNHQLPGALLTLAAIFWLVLPAAFLLFLKQCRLIRSWEMAHAKERRWPLLFLAAIYGVSARGMYAIDLDGRLQGLAAGTSIALWLALFINERCKISLHTLAAGGITAFLGALSYHTRQPDLLYPFLGTIWISGWVYAARIELNAHSHSQLAGGYGVGMGAMLIAYWYFAGDLHT